MRKVIIWNKEDGNRSVSDVVDSLMKNIGVGLSRRSNRRNVAPLKITKAVECGMNPLFVSLRPNTVPERLASGRSREKHKKNSARQYVKKIAVQRMGTVTTDANRASERDTFFRFLTPRKLRAICRCTTKATTLFSLFRTMSLSGECRRVRCRRFRVVKRACIPKQQKAAQLRLNMVFWYAVATVLRHRDAYKSRWHEMWTMHSGSGKMCSLRVVRAFPLFGLVVEVQRMRWHSDANNSDGVPQVSGSVYGVVVHESSDAVGVALFGVEETAADGLFRLRELAERRLESASAPAEESAANVKAAVDPRDASGLFSPCRVLSVTKICPGGCGPTQLNKIVKPCRGDVRIVARVAPEEATASDSPFGMFVGCYL